MGSKFLFLHHRELCEVTFFCSIFCRPWRTKGALPCTNTSSPTKRYVVGHKQMKEQAAEFIERQSINIASLQRQRDSSSKTTTNNEFGLLVSPCAQHIVGRIKLEQAATTNVGAEARRRTRSADASSGKEKRSRDVFLRWEGEIILWSRHDTVEFFLSSSWLLW